MLQTCGNTVTICHQMSPSHEFVRQTCGILHRFAQASSDLGTFLGCCPSSTTRIPGASWGQTGDMKLGATWLWRTKVPKLIQFWVCQISSDYKCEKMMENSRTRGNHEKWRNMMENGGQIWKMIEHDGKWWKLHEQDQDVSNILHSFWGGVAPGSFKAPFCRPTRGAKQRGGAPEGNGQYPNKQRTWKIDVQNWNRSAICNDTIYHLHPFNTQ